jgi:hypothetical protein
VSVVHVGGRVQSDPGVPVLVVVPVNEITHEPGTKTIEAPALAPTRVSSPVRSGRRPRR